MQPNNPWTGPCDDYGKLHSALMASLGILEHKLVVFWSAFFLKEEKKI